MNKGVRGNFKSKLGMKGRANEGRIRRGRTGVWKKDTTKSSKKGNQIDTSERRHNKTRK